MGTSTNAILFYGYTWDEETYRPWTIGQEDTEEDTADKEEWDDRYARLQGCLPPSTPFPERRVKPTRENGWSTAPKDYSAAEQAIIDQYTAYWGKKREIADASLCLVDIHCSSSYPMPYVAIKASVTTNYRGSFTEIRSLAIDPTWDTDLATFCTMMGIDITDKKPAWWLVSYWSE